MVIKDNVKTLTLETHLTSHYCPCCDFRMHSRGISNVSIESLNRKAKDLKSIILTMIQWRG